MKESKEIYVNGVMFFIRKKIVLLIPEDSWLFRKLSLLGMRLNGLKNRKKRTALKIDIPAVEHCNLRCRGCTAFSPLAKESFLDYDGYCRDMRRLADLTDHKLTQVIYTGGEPLLHPQLGDMIKFARKLFPTAEISFLTNGLLLPAQSDEFWRVCSECDVKVSISRYPIQLNDQKIRKIKGKWGIVFDWVGGKDIPVKKMWKYTLANGWN